MDKMIFAHWPEELRQQRGLLNGARVCMAREVRGKSRAWLAHRLFMTAAELRQREAQWTLWDESPRHLLAGLTHFPLHFFTQDDPPSFGVTSLDWHEQEKWNVCDRCEQEEGTIAPENEWAYRADDRCSVCGLDTCRAHTWTEEIDGVSRTFCDTCHRTWAREQTAKKR
jgi:hypothetical protein